MTLSRHSALVNTLALVGLIYTGNSGRHGHSYTEPPRF
jgi:hypothetical protein